MSALAAERDRIVSGFRNFAAGLGADAPAWLPPLREAAIERFAQIGFPSRKREDWKYTNVTPIARALFAPAGDGGAAARAEIEAIASAFATEHALVFLDGRFVPGISSRTLLPDGVVVDSLANVLRDRPDLAKPFLTRETAPEPCFAALNAAFQRDGAFVSLPPGCVIEEPIHLVFISTGGSERRTAHIRNLVAIAESAAAVVVERYAVLGDGEYLTNTVTDVALAANSQLDHVTLVCESERAFHVGTLLARLSRDARFRSHAISLCAALARNQIDAVLEAPGAECVLNGLFLAGGDRHIDNQTTIDHAAPSGTSRELYKGILGGRSKGVFNGKVIVQPDAQKTDARQSNPNLLLSEGAEIDTRPNLEIHANDVKCKHGSTVGRLDEDALFFLRSRGIGEAEAREMLCHAFASEVIDQIPWTPLREEIARCVAAKIGASA